MAIIGGSTGGLICDIEVRSNRYCRDALYARYIAVAMVALSLVIDFLIQGPVTTFLLDANGLEVLVGVGVLVAVGTFGRFTSHRTFTHSVLGLFAFTSGVALICLPLAPAFAIGYVSHVALDLLNKKPIQLLYPFKRGKLCFNLVYANGVTNKVIFAVGVVASITGMALGLIRGA